MSHTLGIEFPMGVLPYTRHIDLNFRSMWKGKIIAWNNIEEWIFHLLHHEFLHILLAELGEDTHSLDNIEWNLTFSAFGVWRSI